MYTIFRNNDKTSKLTVVVENQQYIIDPQSSVNIFTQNETFQFELHTNVIDEMTDAASETDYSKKEDSLKDRILLKLTKKFINKISALALDTVIKYEFTGSGMQTAVIDLFENGYSVCDGFISDFLDLMPVIYLFPRAETSSGSIRPVDAQAINRKKFLKLMRNFLIFSHSGLIVLNLLFFIPEYILIRFLSSHFYLKFLFSNLYRKPAHKRAEILAEKEMRYEKEDEKKGCIHGILKGLILLVLIVALGLWAASRDPDVIIAEDFQSVVCFEETFARIDSGLPENAEDVFLEEYTAYYLLSDGSYDMENYYCYIYETPDGTRYMWLKDNCSNEQNKYKDFEDYENPLVYKSIGNTQ